MFEIYAKQEGEVFSYHINFNGRPEKELGHISLPRPQTAEERTAEYLENMAISGIPRDATISVCANGGDTRERSSALVKALQEKGWTNITLGSN
jgi:hypothetical protein